MLSLEGHRPRRRLKDFFSRIRPASGPAASPETQVALPQYRSLEVGLPLVRARLGSISESIADRVLPEGVLITEIIEQNFDSRHIHKRDMLSSKQKTPGGTLISVRYIDGSRAYVAIKNASSESDRTPIAQRTTIYEWNGQMMTQIDPSGQVQVHTDEIAQPETFLFLVKRELDNLIPDEDEIFVD